jgi:AcrR family transcriptional regulator
VTSAGTTSASEEPDRPGRRSDARRNHARVLAAARAVFAEHGLQATVPQIAQRAGVGKATVYRSYPTKDDLVSSVVREQIADLEHTIHVALAESDAGGALTAVVRDLFERLAGNRLLAEALADGTIAPSAQLLEQLTRLVDAAKSTGRVRADASALDLRVVLCGAVLQLIAIGVRDLRLWRRYADMVLLALRT